ncbi:Nif3-like dinuclear metal center hexameric protein [Geomesophilobacter sediminis]|uniref:GTP cyclohydrolase 1 type 2 homolog n=1 Tax=Geomesophilobacter sediminis TaxID=2798584 RepID=A0A8J7S9A9_9BACT|nr:Nif3-like dinuclear metal center hexameric protein [Geomesophilobacter sediminis]MBJ6726655.1 Nif3-like dinuclear metal center hexameric protein [Geomesophilobacter sediminis]
MITPRVSDIVGITNKIAPPGFAESWDNVGLQLGDPSSPAARIMVALDPGAPAIEAAIAAGTNLLVTHHPFIFTPLKKITAADETGRLALLATKHDLSIISLHTNLDIASGGVNDLLAERIGLTATEPLRITGGQEFLKLAVFVPKGHEEGVLKALAPFSPFLGNYRDCSFQGEGVGRFTALPGATPFAGEVGVPRCEPESRLELLIDKDRLNPALAALRSAHPYEEPAFDLYPVLNRGESRGLGRIGKLPEPMSAQAYALSVKERLGAEGVRLVGDPERPVQKIALCSGSGASLLHDAARKGADLLVTGDLKYHEARDAEALGVAVVDAGHFATERIMIDGLAEALRKALEARRFEAEIITCQGEREPFRFL